MDRLEDEGGVPSRLIKTDAGDGWQKGTPWMMLAGSPSRRKTTLGFRRMTSRGIVAIRTQRVK